MYALFFSDHSTQKRALSSNHDVQSSHKPSVEITESSDVVGGDDFREEFENNFSSGCKSCIHGQ